MTSCHHAPMVPRAVDDAEDFATYRRTGDRQLRDVLVQRHLGLAHALAERYTGRGVDRADLHQVAAVGLVKAVDRFDPQHGTAFSTFAVPTVLGELRRLFRDHGWTIRVPRRLQELRQRADDVVGRLEQDLQRRPTLAEAAAELDEDPDSVLLALDGLRTCYRPAPLATDASVVDPDEPAARAVAHLLVWDLIERLPRRQQQIVVLRYWSDLTQAEIAERVGLSQMHVSRLLRQAITTMREDVGDPDVSDRDRTGRLTP